MKKILTISCLFINTLYSGAQDKQPGRLDIMTSYLVGFQTFKLDKIEYSNSEGLHYIKQQAYYDKKKFRPTFLNHVELFVAPFKNKNWYVGLHGDWGRNSITSYGYLGYPDANVMQLKSISDFNFWSWGYGVKRMISLEKHGSIIAGFSFNEISGDGSTKTTYEVKDITNGQIIKSGTVFGGGSSPSYIPSIKLILRLFDSPKLSLDYHVKLINHVYLKASYSYWLAGAGIANFYGLIDKHKYQWRDDLYSHNLSIGLTLKLLK